VLVVAAAALILGFGWWLHRVHRAHTTNTAGVSQPPPFTAQASDLDFFVRFTDAQLPVTRQQRIQLAEQILANMRDAGMSAKAVLGASVIKLRNVLSANGASLPDVDIALQAGPACCSAAAAPAWHGRCCAPSR